jgi:hypothetical protein
MEMLLIIGTATIAMVMLEYYFVKSFPRFGKWVIHHPARALIFSLVLSFVLTLVFPAAGIMVMIASVTSTLTMRPIYALWRFTDHMKAAWTQRKTSYRARHASVRHPINSRRAV